MIVRRNRILQLMLTLLLASILFPIVTFFYDNLYSSADSLSSFSSTLSSPQSSLPVNHHRHDGDTVDKEFHKSAHTNNNDDNDKFSRQVSVQLEALKSSASSSSLEAQLAFRFSDLMNRVKHAEMVAKERRQEINYLTKEIRYLWELLQNGTRLDDTNRGNLAKIINYKSNINGDNDNDNNDQHAIIPAIQPISADNPIIKDRLFPPQGSSFDGNSNNIFHFRPSNGMTSSESLHLPSLYTLMSYLQLTPDVSLNPAIRIAPKASKTVRFVFGIPTVKRAVESYLISTLQNLITNLTPQERQQACFVVFIAEVDTEFVTRTANDIVARFTKEIEAGLIEIISPPAVYYPNQTDLKQTLDDPIERVHWRSKQNLDFAYLMMYCQPKGIYYIQLEDDIITKPSYLSKMETFIAKNVVSKRDWLVLDFCSLGFIGKMFKSVDLSKFILFFVMFFNDKPVDWLLDNYIQTKVCRFDKDIKSCKAKKDLVWILHKPSLFQHIGTHSSLKGKIQKLRDKGFGKIKVFEGHNDNPKAVPYTTIKHYRNYDIFDAYEGVNYFWGLSPVYGDVIGFKFDKPTNLERFVMKTGNYEHPEDILANATVQIKPSNALSKVMKSTYKLSTDNFVNLTRFDPMKGDVDILIPNELNPVQELRVYNFYNSSHWLLVNEIYVKELTLNVDDFVISTNNVGPL